MVLEGLKSVSVRLKKKFLECSDVDLHKQIWVGAFLPAYREQGRGEVQSRGSIVDKKLKHF